MNPQVVLVDTSVIATAHSVHNGLSVLKETHSFFHGEKVAFGVVTGLHLTGSSPGEMEKVYSFCEKVGQPITFSGIGVKRITRDRLMAVAEKACDPAEGIHHEVFPVNPEIVVKAMIAADAMGKARKKISMTI